MIIYVLMVLMQGTFYDQDYYLDSYLFMSKQHCNETKDKIFKEIDTQKDFDIVILTCLEKELGK